MNRDEDIAPATPAKVESDPIVVVPYRESWSRSFTRHAALIRRALAGGALRIDHVGSTAVAGLAAKPVIDIQVSVQSFEPLATYEEALSAIGYIYRPDDDQFHRFFRNRRGLRRVHLHVREAGGDWERKHLLFRDYLRAHSNVATDYGQLKQSLAVRYRDDRSGYVEAKSQFIERVLRNAADWAMRVGWRVV